MQRRIEANLNGLIPCIKHDPDPSPDQSPHEKSANGLLNGKSVKNPPSRKLKIRSPFEFYGFLLTLFPVKMVVLLLTGVLLGFSVWGNVLLRQEFDPMWFLPKDSYLSLYVEQNDK